MLASLASENIQGCSLLEELPRELVWMILEYAAESISELRLTSPLLCSQVDEFALHNSTFCVVDELAIRRYCELLYEMRFIIEEDNGMLITLGKCIGKRVAKISIASCDYQNELNVVSDILNGIRFGKLQFLMPRYFENGGNFLLETLKAHPSIDLTLIVDKAGPRAKFDAVKFLLDLSALVESLHILQTDADLDNGDFFGQPGPFREPRYFFGLHDVDWAPIILEMFSKKLTKLYITNYPYRGYLSNRSAETLRKHLPLLGKKICFKTWTWTPQYTESNSISNNHFVNVTATNFTVKHATRVNESFDLYHEPTEWSF